MSADHNLPMAVFREMLKNGGHPGVPRRRILSGRTQTMLVLTRKMNESICINGDIEVMVVGVRGNKVRLGFRAPAAVSIQRKERAVGGDAAPRGAASPLRFVEHAAAD